MSLGERWLFVVRLLCGFGILWPKEEEGFRLRLRLRLRFSVLGRGRGVGVGGGGVIVIEQRGGLERGVDFVYDLDEDQ